MKKSKEVLVIWPSAAAVGRREVPTLDEILASCKAIGYVGIPRRVQSCTYVVVTTGKNETPSRHYLAKVVKASRNRRLTGRIEKGDLSCFDLQFSDPQRIESAMVDKLVWSTRNVRFVNEGKLLNEIQQYLKAVNGGPS